MTTQLLISGHSDSVSVISGTDHNVQIITNPPKPGIPFLILNKTPFPDEELKRVVTDDYGEALTYLTFENLTGSPISITIQAYEDTWLWPESGDSNLVVVTVSPRGTGTPDCLKEGEFYIPYITEECCPGLETSITNPFCHKPSAPCLPPGGVQRKCNDTNTIAVWNQVDCRYDIASCGTREHCENGNCVTDTPPGCIPTARKCETPLNGYDTDSCTRKVNSACNPITPPGTKKYSCVSGQCTQSSTGAYTSSTCGGACKPSSGTSNNDAITAFALVIAAGIAIKLLMKKEK